MSDKISLNIEGKLITVSKSILQQFSYFKSIIERWNAEPIFIDCDHKLFRHLLNIARIPNYTVPITELGNITKLADYYGLTMEIPKCHGTNMITETLYNLYHHKNIISGVTHMLFHNIWESNRSSLKNSKPEKLKIYFKIRYTNNLKTLIVRENIFMTHNPYMDASHNNQKVICSEFL